MDNFEEYLSQDSNISTNTSHIDEHTDTWVDEADQSYGHSGHCDSHTDAA